MQSYLLTKNHMAVKANHRNIDRNEVIVYTTAKKSFNKQLQFLLDNLEELYTKYPSRIEHEYDYLNQPTTDIYHWEKNWIWDVSSEPMDWFWREMGIYKMINETKQQVKKTVEKWYKKRFRVLKNDLEANGFYYNTEIPVKYTEKFWELNLSNFKWSISRTTKRNVTKILKKWLIENVWVWQMSKQIRALSGSLFSKSRAEMIAVTEIGKAYEYWNLFPVKQLNQIWIAMLKLWSSVWDAKVRESHRANESEWRKPVDYVYWATGTDTAPTGVNCRCTMLYKRQ